MKRIAIILAIVSTFAGCEAVVTMIPPAFTVHMDSAYMLAVQEAAAKAKAAQAATQPAMQVVK